MRIKQLIILCFLCLTVNISYAGTLQEKAAGFFGGTTTNNINIGSKDNSKDNSKVADDYAGKSESIWNLDIYGMDFILPHQPANEQFVPSLTGIGLTYKFNQHAQLWFRYSTFSVEGVKLDDVDTEWKHTHYVGGYGFRFNLENNKRITVNLGVSKTRVEETKQFGEVEELKTGLALDTKYLWTDRDMTYGLMLSLVQVGSKAETWDDHRKGGYVSIGAALQIALPNLLE